MKSRLFMSQTQKLKLIRCLLKILWLMIHKFQVLKMGWFFLNWLEILPLQTRDIRIQMWSYWSITIRARLNLWISLLITLIFNSSQLLNLTKLIKFILKIAIMKIWNFHTLEHSNFDTFTILLSLQGFHCHVKYRIQ